MMTSPTSAADAAIADYLDDLRDQLAPLPRERRRELVRDLEVHIATARAELADPLSEAEVRNLLDRLGTPEEIAEAEGLPTAAAAPWPGAPVAPERVAVPAGAAAPAQSRSTWREPAAIVLLLFGGFISGIGWIVGLILLWTSPRWRTLDKLVGTFVLPGGLATSFLAALVLAGTSAPCGIANGIARRAGEPLGLACDSGVPWTTIVLFVAIFLLPLASAAYLAFGIGRGDEDAA